MGRLADLLRFRQVDQSRRNFMAGSGMAGAAALAAGFFGSAVRQTQAAESTSFGPKGHRRHVNDMDILNFALNLEYLEAEYYLLATTGVGLTTSESSGVVGSGKKPREQAAPGAVTGGRQVPFAVPEIQQIAQKIAADEHAHVQFLRLALGDRAVARPAIDLQNSFNAAAVAAGIGSSFDPFASDDDFLLGAFIFEDVGVTAYHGAAPFIQKPSIVNAAAGILGTEAYHAGSVRTILGTRGQANPSLIAIANKISALRAKADGSTGGNEQPLTLDNGNLNIAPTDAEGITFGRTFQEVLNIVYLGAAKGGFFPDGLNGEIA